MMKNKEMNENGKFASLTTLLSITFLFFILSQNPCLNKCKRNKCVRSMFFAHSRDYATPYYNLLGILKFENVYKLKVALFTRFNKHLNNIP